MRLRSDPLRLSGGVTCVSTHKSQRLCTSGESEHVVAAKSLRTRTSKMSMMHPRHRMHIRLRVTASAAAILRTYSRDQSTLALVACLRRSSSGSLRPACAAWPAPTTAARGSSTDDGQVCEPVQPHNAWRKHISRAGARGFRGGAGQRRATDARGQGHHQAASARVHAPRGARRVYRTLCSLLPVTEAVGTRNRCSPRRSCACTRTTLPTHRVASRSTTARRRSRSGSKAGSLLLLTRELPLAATLVRLVVGDAKYVELTRRALSASGTVKKVIEINPYLLGTMAGGAGQCRLCLLQ